MPKHYEFEGAKYVALSDHEGEINRTRESAVNSFKKSEEYNTMSTELNGFKSEKRLGEIKSKHLNNFNVKSEYQEDVMKLTGISTDMEDKEIKKALTAFSSNSKYSHMLNVEGQSDTHTPTNDSIPETSAPTRGGGTFWDRLKRK